MGKKRCYSDAHKIFNSEPILKNFIPKIIQRKRSFKWRNPQYSILKRLDVIKETRCMVHESKAKKATTTHVG